MAYFLNAAPEAQWDHNWKEKTGSWTSCPGEICCSYKDQNIC